jgi:hypothetical protein
MTREVHDSWREFDAAVAVMLARVRIELCVWDSDLVGLHLEDPERFEKLSDFLKGHPAANLRIALRNTDRLASDHPRLLSLLRYYGHRFRILHVNAGLRHLRDTLLIADGAHVVVRHEQAQPRTTLILDDPADTEPWRKRFEDIWMEGGSLFTPTTLGL